jgi:excisionase family DNA binding protein
MKKPTESVRLESLMYSQSGPAKQDDSKRFCLIEQLERRQTALKVSEVAKMLTTSSTQVYRWAESGKIPAFRLGTMWRFDPRVIATWLREKLTTQRVQFPLHLCLTARTTETARAIPVWDGLFVESDSGCLAVVMQKSFCKVLSA